MILDELSVQKGKLIMDFDDIDEGFLIFTVSNNGVDINRLFLSADPCHGPLETISAYLLFIF